ncbi:MAG: phenylalanine--tRNA ligase subunit alpha [Candidatus Nanohaloarchaeota archaeon QJJ-9]|nr:phenylalanine--tRNA ligase subunit alpha [Candidatus Nanohaloarchaeota archaeon QJJ-9]
MELHPKAEKLLRTIKKREGAAKVEELEEEMSHGDIMRPAKWLEDNSLVNIEDEREKFYELRSKGQNAYINGLPEKRLLKLVEDGAEKLEDVREQIGPFDVAVGECKSSRWIEMLDSENGKKIQITDEGKDKLEEGFKKEEILEKVSDKEKVGETDELEEMIDRGLVKEEEKSWTTLKITDKGTDKVEELEEKSEEEKSKKSQKIGTITPEVIKSGDWKEKGIRKFNVEADVKPERPGKKQFYRQYLDKVRKKLLYLGFKEAKTDLVETEFWDFDVLFQAQDHPAREIHDKFELSNPKFGEMEDDKLVKRVKEMHEKGGSIDSAGWGYKWSEEKASKLMLRSQTTATSARYLAKDLDSPAKVFTIDRNFRYDDIDPTHFIEFFQVEGIVKGPDLSLKNLLGYLKIFGKEIAGAEKIRFRPGYFPFTEPSVELDAYHPEMGWVELGGAGMFRPEVRQPLGVEDEVIAWGLGIDRLAMFKLGIDDIRELVFTQDLEKLRKSSTVELR